MPFAKILKIAAVNLALLLAVALAAELVFGGWLTGPGYRTLNLPRNVARKFDVSTLYPGGGIAAYTRDKYGLRGTYADLSKIDVLTVGGSTTNQLYVDDAKTWESAMTGLFAAAGRPRAVVNAGVDGQSTRGHLRLFDKWFPLVPNLKARYVLAYVGINDAAVDAETDSDTMQAADPLRRIRHLVANYSAIYGIYDIARGMLLANRANLIHGAGRVDRKTWVDWGPASAPLPPPAPERAKQLAAYEKRLTALVGRIRAFGAEPILATQPMAAFRAHGGRVRVPLDDAGKPAPSAYLHMAPINAVTRKVAAATGAILLDVAAEVAFDDADFYDWVHSTPSGTAKIGRFMFEKLRDRI